MSFAYIVVVTNDKAEVEIIETYAGVQAALGRAWHLAVAKANNPSFINTSPDEEKLEDGSIRWVFLETSKYFVGVFFRKIETHLASRNDREATVSPAPITVLPLSPIMLDAYQIPGQQQSTPAPTPSASQSLDDDNLPAGWFYDGTPAKMKHLKESAEDIKNPVSQLNDDEKWALATARVSKRLNYLTSINGYTYIMGAALADLKAKTPAGLVIRDKEMSFLNDYRAIVIDSYYK